MKPTWALFGKILGGLTGLALFFFAEYKVLDSRFSQIEISIEDLKGADALMQKDVSYIKSDITGLKSDISEIRTKQANHYNEYSEKFKNMWKAK